MDVKLLESPLQTDAVSLRASSNGRVSGKSWKLRKSGRSQLSQGRKAKSWDERMEKTKKARAIKMLQQELKHEKTAEHERRRQIVIKRRQAEAEKRRLEEEKAKMGARKAARLRRRVGRSKKVNG